MSFVAPFHSRTDVFSAVVAMSLAYELIKEERIDTTYTHVNDEFHTGVQVF